MPTKLSKAAVAYEHPAKKPANRCELCRHFEQPNACEIVSGSIAPGDWCNKFVRKSNGRGRELRYAFFTFSGESLSIAKRLADEGNEVVVGQAKRCSTDEVESPERRRRRLSLFDGMDINKVDADELIRKLRPEISSWFVITDHNNLCEYGEKLLAMGASGFISNAADHARERDRAAAKKFVEKHYDMVEIPELKSLKRAEEGTALVEDSDDFWVLKSNGNMAPTIVPRTSDLRLNHAEICGALKTDTKEYESGGYTLERRIINHIEFAPQMAFWNGDPLYSIVDIECKQLGAGNIGPDTGGAIHLVVKTNLDDPVNTMFFPPEVHKLAKDRRGLFMFDAGILYDLDDDVYYFTEFCGNRWGYGTIFAELAMATEKNRNASEYFERIAAGKNPLRYNFGATVGLYNVGPDTKFPSLEKPDIPLYCRRSSEGYFWPLDAKQSGDCIVSVGYSDVVGYASGCGDSLAQCVDFVYKVVEGVSFREAIYRPKFDFLSREYPQALLPRFDFLNREHFSLPSFRRSSAA